MTIIVHVQEEDFLDSDPVMHSLLRQRYPITLTDLETQRDGMQYINLYSEIFELNVNDWLDLKAKVSKVYVLRYKGCAHLSVRMFLRHLDYLESTRKKHDPAWLDYPNFWGDDSL